MDWGPTPATPEDLYLRYDNDTAAATIHALQRIRQLEPEITASLLQAAATSDVQMTAALLAFRVKSPQSMARKIAAKVAATLEISPEATGDRLTDVLRYTFIVDQHDQLVTHARTVVSNLQSRDWTVVEAEHSYVAGNPYKGLHLVMRSPTGQVVEVQVHSVPSQAVKDRMHVDYERQRDLHVPSAARAAARERMIRAWQKIRRPAGLDGLVLGGVDVVEKTYSSPLRPLGRRDQE